MTDEVLKWIQEENLICEGDEVIVGVSGGADSVCLLLVLLALREKIGFSLRAVHVEHGIRGAESEEDAKFVEVFCKEREVPCRIYHKNVPDFAKEQNIGLEEAARVLRYDCYQEEVEKLRQEMEKCKACNGVPMRKIKIALAHHADDNAETILFQMVRGSGMRGLVGIRSKRDFSEDAEIIRPLLRVTREEIETYLKEAQQNYQTDSSNYDIEYSRNRIRHEVMPQLTKVNSRAVYHITKSARRLKEVLDYMEDEVQTLIPVVCQKLPEGYLILQSLYEEYPAVIQREMILHIMGIVAGSRKDIGNVHVESVIDLAKLQVGRRIALPYAMCAERVYEGIRIIKEEKELPTQIEPKMYEVTSEMLSRAEAGENISITLPDGEILLRVFEFQGKMQEIQKKKYTKWLDYDKIKNSLQIRRRVGGDYLVIDETGHRKKIKEYFIEEKIPADERNKMWLVTDASHVIWVIGGRISSDYKIQKNTEKILEIQIIGGKYYED